MVPGSILIVDDDRNLLELMGMMLKSADYEVTTAHDGEGALSAMKGQAFDLAVVDLKLPGTDGISLMRELHQINPEMPVIILTALSRPSGWVPSTTWRSLSTWTSCSCR